MEKTGLRIKLLSRDGIKSGRRWAFSGIEKRGEVSGLSGKQEILEQADGMVETGAGKLRCEIKRKRKERGSEDERGKME